MADIPADLLAEAAQKRANMVERIAELDDDLIVKFLEGEETQHRRAESRLAPGCDRQHRPLRYFAALRCAIKAFSRCWMR